MDDARFGSCPVCAERLLIEELTAHVNSHFPSPVPSPPPDDDVQLQKMLQTSEACLEVESQAQQPASDFDLLPTDPVMLAAVQTADHQFAPNENTLSMFETVYLTGRQQRDGTSILCVSGPLQHFCSTDEDRGWGCGYRNCQMLISHLLLRSSHFRQDLFGGAGYVPDIPSLQAWLECAWKEGYDPEGKHSLEGSVQGGNKRVGAVDIAAMLRQFGVNVQFVDFIGTNSSHHPNYAGGTIHHGFTCDLCKARKIVGHRHHSQRIPDFDVCEHCVHTAEAASFAPYSIHGKQEIHGAATCTECGTTPIVGVKYQQMHNWRDVLCQACYLHKNPLEQAAYRHHLRSKASSKPQNTQEQLTSWVWEYFTRGLQDLQCLEGQLCRFVSTEKAPLYFQHDGHSRTIVGIEQVTTTGRHASVSYNLIIFDPSSATASLRHSFEQRRGWQRMLKRGLHTLRQAEYQVLYIEDGIVPESNRNPLKRCRPAEQVFS